MATGAHDYDMDALVKAYRDVGLSEGKTVYLTGNFGRLGRYPSPDKQKIFEDHLEAIFSLIKSSGTLIVPTHSFSLCNTDQVYDHENTPSETGPFTEFVRRQPGAIRQLHPFSSSTALGAAASEICTNNSRHVYGWNSPFQRMVERDAIHVSIGKELNRTISLVHHVELMMGVPYRYVKEFEHPCRIGGVESRQCFYLYVLYRECDIERDRNVKIMQSFERDHPVRRAPLGRSELSAVSTRQFFDHCTRLMCSDIYAWLRRPPEVRPYQR